jgi:hypothetical protein
MDTVDATRDAILQTTDSEKDKYLDTFLDYDQDELLSNIGVSGNTNSERIAQAVLGEDGYN